MTNNDLEVEIFAADLYMFLIPRRLGVLHTPTILPSPCDKTIYTDDIGKAVLITCYRVQEILCKKFTKEHEKFSKNPDAFLRYCIEIGYVMFDESDDDVFDSLFLVSAMILELVSFCHVQTFALPPWYADFCWAELFKLHFRRKFFEKGGWYIFRERAQSDAMIYDSAKYNVKDAQKKTNKWLKRFDRQLPGLLKSHDSQTDKVDQDESSSQKARKVVEKEQSDSDASRLEVTSFDAGKVGEGKNTPIESSKIRSVDLGSSRVGEANPTIEPGFDCKTGKTIPTGSQGAIPKTRIKASKSRDKAMKCSERELVGAFVNAIVFNNDIGGEHLCTLLENENPAKLLMRDRRFVDMMKSTLTDPEDKPSNEEMLDYALKVLCPIKTRTAVPLGKALYQTEKRYPETPSSQEPNSDGKLSNSPRRGERTPQPLPKSPTADENMDPEENNFEGERKAEKKRAVSATNVKMLPPSDVTVFNENLTSEVDKCGRESNVFPSAFEPKKDISEEIINALDRFDSLVEETRSYRENLTDDIIKLADECRDKRCLMSTHLITQFLFILSSQTNELLSKTQIFTAGKFPEEHDEIIKRLNDNKNENRNARETIGFKTPVPTPSSDSAGRDSKADSGTQSDESPTKNVESLPSKEYLDDRRAQRLRKTLEGLLHAHVESRKLLDSLNQKLSKPLLFYPSDTNVQSGFPPDMGLTDHEMMDLIINKLSSEKDNPHVSTTAFPGEENGTKVLHQSPADTSGHQFGDFTLHSTAEPVGWTVTVKPPPDDKAGNGKKPDEHENDGFDFYAELPAEESSHGGFGIRLASSAETTKDPPKNKLSPIQESDEKSVPTNKGRKKNRRRK